MVLSHRENIPDLIDVFRAVERGYAASGKRYLHCACTRLSRLDRSTLRYANARYCREVQNYGSVMHVRVPAGVCFARFAAIADVCRAGRLSDYPRCTTSNRMHVFIIVQR